MIRSFTTPHGGPFEAAARLLRVRRNFVSPHAEVRARRASLEASATSELVPTRPFEAAARRLGVRKFGQSSALGGPETFPDRE